MPSHNGSRAPRCHRLVAQVAFAAALVAPWIEPPPAPAKDFDPRVITFGETRDQIKSTPVTERPNRPLHVYGNTVRRRADRSVRSPAARGR